MRFRVIAGLIIAVGIVLPAQAGAAGESPDLYQVRVLVTGQGAENRDDALQRGLAGVLIKVSGDPEIAAAAHGLAAAPLVKDFRYRDLMAGIPVHDEQGTRQRPYEMTIDFDPGKVDAALAGLGETAWTGERPRIAVFVAVRNGDASYVLSSDGTRGIDQRDSLAAAAWSAGLPIVLPTAADLARMDFSVDTFTSTDPERLIAPATGGGVVLAGRLVWDAAMLGWATDWRLAEPGSDPGADRAWHRDKVSFDEAFRAGMRGAAAILSGHDRAN
jgi:hypothetical protein